MVKLRLRRRGRKKHPFYDIVAIDGRARRDGAAIERVGWVDPMTTPNNVVVDTQRAIYWLNVGAQPTDVVRQIFSREGVMLHRALAFKGLAPAEIEQQVQQHRERALARYNRLKARRKERAAKKAEAANTPAEEPAAEVAPSADEAPAAEAPETAAE
ncbi:MAG: 30S ribosomal protein S16 [Chlorobi bacterium]|nr:MAG: 30S ribosomal protein S16 [Bacteroidota bacterium]MBE2266321.1 30S ribosomal protein S16 [Flavobacteriales bacterium]MBL1162105.1 30S ribosomal protein S16 [Chlorobiota bacterium]MBW7854582.1 30S ribosomal protein S16 [Candidatus Kapabacteria bacterium]MCC6331943.1 30S ribosomal protein S16 [Ignavibacteria bacterium]